MGKAREYKKGKEKQLRKRKITTSYVTLLCYLKNLATYTYLYCIKLRGNVF